jgi:formylglycine-generating enzyme
LDLPQAIIKVFSVVLVLGLGGTAEDDVAVALAASPEKIAVRPLPSAAIVSAAPAPSAAACDEGMMLVDGEYCPEVDHVCVKWLDPPPYANLRCGEYAKPAKCKGSRLHRRFCIDREEYSESPSCAAGDAPGSDTCPILPVVNKNWNEASALCSARGARLCKETEWEFACEGPDMSPYPYGWKRDATLCNFDKTDLGGPMEKLKDLRAPISAYPECTSPFGAHDMVGNVDEWVEREGMQPPNRSALRGGWWLPGRNRCRAATTAHGEEYSGKQVGFRCCKDAR